MPPGAKTAFIDSFDDKGREAHAGCLKEKLSPLFYYCQDTKNIVKDTLIFTSFTL